MSTVDFMGFVKWRLIPILRNLSDAEHQVAVWGKKHPKYQYSFAEAYEEIFDVCGFFEEADEYGERTLNHDNLSLLVELRDKVAAFKISPDEYADTEILIKNPKWIEIQELAGKLLKSVKKELDL